MTKQIRDRAILVLICCGLAMAQTLVNHAQVSNTPDLPSRFGFNCTSVGPSTTCEIDRAYILHLEPTPFDGSSTPPSPGPCPSTGSVIVTNEPAAYFCVRTAPGLPDLNWIRVAGTNTW